MRAIWAGAALFLAMAPTLAAAGPFGLTQGTPVSRLLVVKKLDGDYRYEVRVPTPLSEFDFYIATVTPGEGLCRVTAIGRTLENDSNGASARAVYTSLKNALDEKYGNSKAFDFVHLGALFDKPSEFAMAIFRNERSLSAFWDNQERSRLPADLSSIQLSVKALSSSKTYVNISYELGNFDACQRSINSLKSRAL